MLNREKLSAIKKFFAILLQTAKNWWARDPFRDSAVIAYYTIFSLPGLLIVMVTLAGYAFDKKSVETEVTATIGQVMGGESASIINNIFENTNPGGELSIASIFGAFALLFGATAVFAQLQKSLNNIWELEPAPKQMILKFLRDRLFSFGIVLTIGFLLLVSLLLSTSISVLSDWIAVRFSLFAQILVSIFDVAISLTAITFLLAAMFKFLPDAHIEWRNVWPGAVLTSVLFVIGKYSLAFYLSRSDPTSAYGAAGSVVLVMLWVSYGSLLVLFGAEFSREYTLQTGGDITPTDIAQHRANQ